MKRISFLMIAMMATCTMFAQNNDAVLLKVGNESITKGTFLNAYQKNNDLKSASEKDLREYLTLYAKYRMKVQEAESLKMDTSEAFQHELKSYKDQSAQQYLIDTDVSDRLLNEAFERAKSQVRASHIMIKCEQNASPKDTLAAYNKIMSIREKIMNGMDFNEAAVQYSEDPSARDYVNPQNGRLHHGNSGDLGYFSVLDMIYPFECAAFNTPVGKISMPVHTKFGYHIVYVQDKIPAIAGMYVSQIFVKDTLALSDVANPEVNAKLREIIRRLNNGSASFEQLVTEFSEDNASKEKGGAMLPFAPNKRPGNYVAAALNLEPGQVSEPVPSSMGWHILRLDSIRYVRINDELRYALKNRLSRDPRSHNSQNAFIERLKKEYNYEESGKKAAMKFFKKNVPDSYFSSMKGNLSDMPGIEKLKPMFTYADRQVSAADFAIFFSRYKGITLKEPVVDFLNHIFPSFVAEDIVLYEREHLESKYPEYKDLVNEFHDGMLLYEINSKKVWNASAEDSVGLQKFYESIKTQFATTDSTGAPTFKPLEEVRATVINQYQEYLEKAWLMDLQAKYPVVIDEKVFQSILKR
ncbi:MAG: peptidylprolyl isomerase [Bacteroidales bacterium]|nr:peptidylprolyl isomerase [Bacteroidales bacterium]